MNEEERVAHAHDLGAKDMPEGQTASYNPQEIRESCKLGSDDNWPCQHTVQAGPPGSEVMICPYPCSGRTLKEEELLGPISWEDALKKCPEDELIKHLAENHPGAVELDPITGEEYRDLADGKRVRIRGPARIFALLEVGGGVDPEVKP